MNPQLIRRLTLASYAALIVNIIIWYFISDPPRFVFSTILSLMYLMLILLPAYGLIRKRPATYMWSSYLILLLFMHAIVETYANQAFRIYAIVELLLSLVFFIGTTLCVRYMRKGTL